jgi:hydroxymethylpyrimidine pyrophosphatase-like HAD family hydrolase
MILIDLDRTLINEDYQITDPRIAGAIGKKREEGWEIGLNSDTPFLTLYGWWRQLGMNGPIIIEKGAAAWHPEDDAEVVYTRAGSVVEASKANIIAALTRMSGLMLVYGDATGFIRGVHQLPGVLDPTLVAFNGLRRFSIGFFVRAVSPDTGDLTIDNKLAGEVIGRIRGEFPHSELLSEGTLDQEFGFFYVNPTDVGKGSTALEVFKNCHVTRGVIIGDSTSDFASSTGVEVYAVGNAYADFKKKAHKVAGATYTGGVIELLEQL